MGASLDNLFGIHTAAMDIWQRRSELLANNLANTDTPGFKARDVDFRKALQAVSGTSTNLALATPSAGQIDPGTEALTRTAWRVPTQPSMDGNTVDPHVEQAAFAGNTVHYQASLSFITAQIHMLRTALSSDQS
ncbi:flagellar basal body rod protein FlgB [Aerosticca soli]|jgi:flagellar basal-body rod protein FlgB|uniref:Flagellar basal body rod protein FlgB n=1 Tax=Aerosticca soli TaxID=2010829 RepID=A0A2Z6E8G9_9GAMM|nr:flagellar basal body rod protein FlgB [Aerosticca soli]MDI3262965.1 flagellar basal body rod protein FlgB [Fulvimonas sp.]BBD81031.1 flagellar basal-body rod protein FlgB [Aerosticca soli]